MLSRFGLMLVADKERAFARIADVLAPGGRLAFATWTAPGRVPIVSLAFGVAAGMLELPPPPPGLPGPFSMADPEAVRPLLEAAGFGDVTATELTATFTADSVTEFVEYACGTLPPWLLGRLRERFGADLAEVKEAVAGATAAYTGDDGTVLMPSVALGVSAVRR